MSGEFQGRHSAMGVVGASVQSLIRQDQYANLLVSEALPRYADLAINRKIFTANSAAGTNLAPIVAPPTTAAKWLLFNPADSGKLIFPLAAWMVLESGTRAIGSSLWGCVPQLAQATAPTAYANSINKGVGHVSTASGIFAGNVTLDASEAWFMIAAADRLADANESSGLIAKELPGWIVVPPGRLFAIAVHDSGAGTTPLYGGGFVWAEFTASQP